MNRAADATGLSFVAFQCLSYTIDVYRKDIVARDSWLELTLFISFFPQIVAGPIVRAADFLPQLDELEIEGLVILEPVEVIRYAGREPGAS